MNERKRVLSVTIHDCEVQTFRAGGPGGQKQNKTSSGARVIHHPSGARGECREERSQLQNKRRAFLRMIETPAFKTWMRIKLGHEAIVDAQVDRMMWPVNIKTEVREDGKWVEE